MITKDNIEFGIASVLLGLCFAGLSLMPDDSPLNNFFTGFFAGILALMCILRITAGHWLLKHHTIFPNESQKEPD